MKNNIMAIRAEIFIFRIIFYLGLNSTILSLSSKGQRPSRPHPRPCPRPCPRPHPRPHMRAHAHLEAVQYTGKQVGQTVYRR